MSQMNSNSNYDSAWHNNTNYIKLKEFSKKNGHCNVPFKGELRYLAKWATRLKATNRTHPGKIRPEKRKSLDVLGFDWSSQKEKEGCRWNEIYQRLAAFKAESGNLKLSSSNKIR